MNRYSHIFLIGIGGIGMSALARYFAYSKKHVAGYDRSSSALISKLQKEGIQVSFEDIPTFPDPAFMDPTKTLVIYTPAISQDNKLFHYFKENNYTILKRAEVLGLITENFKTIAVAGTHGKTSVSSMIAHLMHQSSTGCTAILGGIPKNYLTNFLFKEDAKYIVTEADEYDKSFLKLHPYFAVITSTDADHLDIYGNGAAMLETFNAFAGQVNPAGLLLVKYDAGINTSHLKVKQSFTYSLEDSNADVYARNFRLSHDSMYFDMVTRDVEFLNLEMQALGIINIENALAAIFVALSAGLSESEIRKGLQSFSGVHRRLDRQFVSEKLVYIDDYAHHPEEIRALIKSVSILYPNKKICGIFQPHLYSRTRDFANGFAETLSLLDEVILLDIYPAREKPIENVSSELIYQRINHAHKSLVSKDNLLNSLQGIEAEVLLTIGAGDIDKFVEPIKQMLINSPQNKPQS